MNRNNRLSPAPLVLFLGLFLCLYAPLCYWTGLSDPLVFDLRGAPYPVRWAEIVTVMTMATLFIVPLSWIYFGRVIDLVALNFGLNALIVLGYFFLDITGPKIFGAAPAVMDASALVLALNAIGFFVLLAVLVAWYGFLAAGQRELRPLAGSPETMDRQLRWFLYPVMLLVLFMIALPMLLTGTVPILSSDPMEGRMLLQRSDLGRPFYNLASSVLPALTASCLILALRRKSWFGRLFNPEVFLAGAVVVVQFLTSNRLPLAITLLTTFALFTMERKLSRFLLPLIMVLFFAFYLGLSGFSSILRQNRALLESGNVLQASFSEAFVGNNLADLRDGAWVLGEWDFKPLNGKTYLGGLVSMVPSAIFPQKKEWYLGLIGIKIVNWPTEDHFGLRLSFFVESFLNFGLAGVAGLGVVLGSYFGYGLRTLHLAAAAPTPCLTRNLRIVLVLQLGLTLANSSEGFVLYSILALMLLMWLVVDLPILNRHETHRPQRPLHRRGAAHRNANRGVSPL